MEGHVNTYGGLNTDTAYDSIKPNLYIEALDIRISTTTGESQGAFTNIKGNEFSFSIPKSGTFDNNPPNPPVDWGLAVVGTPEVIGYGTIRETIVLFVADDSGNNGWIYTVKYDPASKQLVDFSLIYYSDKLNFKKQWPIEALGRYENAAVQKIYWTDYNNFFRVINIVEPTLATTEVGLLDSFPDVEFTQPILSSIIGGGALFTGMYQIAYRLISFDGKETIVSPPSNMIHIVTSSEYDNIASYVGEPEKVQSNKTIVISLDTTEYFNAGLPKFEQIEFFALYYENDSATPVASSIELLNITGNSIEFEYNGDENSIFDIELFEFTRKNIAFKTFKSLAQKDNYLVGANIKSSTISVEELLEPGDSFKTFTPRYNTSQNLLSGTNLERAFNEDFNQDKHWDTDWHKNKQYKYQKDGATLGGGDPTSSIISNISYSFHLERTTLDTDSQSDFNQIFSSSAGYGYDWDYNHDLDDGYNERPNPSYSDPSSPFISGLLRGYKRGETYRFGIIFYTKKGEATYVEYIGDIKFPDISEEDAANNLSNSKYFPIAVTTGYLGGFDPNTFGTIGMSLGIKFKIDFSTCPSLLENIESYQIVRVPRKSGDKRRVAQGMLVALHNAPVGNNAPNDFDFRIEGSDNIVHQHNYYTAFPTPPVGVDRFTYDSFSKFVDQQNPLCAINPGSSQSIIKGQHVSFYSPEVSNRDDAVIDALTNQANAPAYLMTGNYSFRRNTASANGTPPDLSESKKETAVSTVIAPLGSAPNQIVDITQKLTTTQPVSFNSFENCKTILNTSYFDMRDSTNVFIDTKIASWGVPQEGNNGNVYWNSPTNPNPPTLPVYTGVGLKNDDPVYMRNYYAFPGGVGGDDLNDPITGANFSTVARAGSNISSLTGYFEKDPLNPTTTYIPGTSQSLFDFFHIEGNCNVAADIVDAGYTHKRINSERLNSIAPLAPYNNKAIPLVDIIIPRLTAYGGNTQNALENNEFICASPIIDKAETNPIVYGGDIFITMFHFSKSMVEFNGDLNDKYTAPFTNSIIMPVESTVNNSLSFGANTTTNVKFKYSNGNDEDENEYYRQEDNNTFSDFAKFEPGADRYNLFSYNQVYSRINKDVLFFIKPQSIQDLSLTNDVRSYLSSIKVNGESIDSWTRFALNDFHDVDDHGPINKIINFKDNVLFLQDQATGVYAINREAITTTDDGVPTELGTAKGWGKHQYYSTEIGSIHQWAVAATNNAVYFFDAIHRKIYQLGQGKQGMSTNPLSELKGMHAYLQELPKDVFTKKFPTATINNPGGDNPILRVGAHIGVDEINDEVIFTFLSKNEGEKGIYKSLVFDELVNQFSTELSCKPQIWINNADILLSTDDVDPDLQSVYTHNIGNWGEFYGDVKTSMIKLVINPKADINKVLRFLEFNSIVRGDDKIIDRTQTITSFRIETETQDSGEIVYSPDRIKRRFDKWRIKLPRDKDSRGRFRSTHFLLTLYFNNTYNKELIMNKLISYYNPQIF